MRQVYSRGNYFGGGRTFQLDIWKNKNDQLFMRCWSHYSDYLPGSFSITGVNPESTRSRTANLTSEKNGFRKSSGTRTTIGPEKSFDLTSIEPDFSSVNLPCKLQFEPNKQRQSMVWNASPAWPLPGRAARHDIQGAAR